MTQAKSLLDRLYTVVKQRETLQELFTRQMLMSNKNAPLESEVEYLRTINYMLQRENEELTAMVISLERIINMIRSDYDKHEEGGKTPVGGEHLVHS